MPAFTIKNKKEYSPPKNAIELPKIGWIKARWSDNVAFERIKCVTIIRVPSGYYKASVLVESDSQDTDKVNKQVDLNRGQKDLLIGSDEELYRQTQTYQKHETKLKHWQKKMARRKRLAKEKGIPLDEAKNYQKAKQMVEKYNEKIHRYRTDFLAKNSNVVKRRGPLP